MDVNKNRRKLSLTEKNNYTNERSYLVRKLDNWSKQIRADSLCRSEGGEYGNEIGKPFAKETAFTTVKNVARQVWKYQVAYKKYRL